MNIFAGVLLSDQLHNNKKILVGRPGASSSSGASSALDIYNLGASPPVLRYAGPFPIYVRRIYTYENTTYMYII